MLFQLDTRVADIAVEQGRQAVEYAEQVFERQKKLGPGEATSQRLYQEAEQNLAVARNELKGAEAQRALLTITTPLGGTVVRVGARPGDTVDSDDGAGGGRGSRPAGGRRGGPQRGHPAPKLGQPAEIWTEREAVGAPSAGASTYRGAVVFIGPEVDPGPTPCGCAPRCRPRRPCAPGSS